MFSQRLICVSPIEAGSMPKYGHHAVKSPYFDEMGIPKFLDPLLILSKTYALDPSLAPASALVLCVDQYPQYSQLKPIQHWLKSQTNEGKLEGKLSLGEIKKLNASPFEFQFNETWLLCVCDPLAQQFEWGLAWAKLNEEIKQLANGQVLRLPLSIALEKDAFDQKELWQLLSTLQEKQKQGFHHKLLLCTKLNPKQFEDDAENQLEDLLLNVYLKRALMLGILDGLACHAYDAKQILGISEDFLTELCDTQKENFNQATLLIDQAIVALCQKNKLLSIQKMGEAVMKCSIFAGVFEFFRLCVLNQNFLLKQLYDELFMCLHAHALEKARLLSIAFLRLYDDPQLYQLSRQIDYLCKKSRRSEIEALIAMGYFENAQQLLKSMKFQENLPLPPMIWHGYPREDQKVEEEQLWAKWEQRITKSKKNAILWLEIERACYLSIDQLQNDYLSSSLQAKLENQPNWLIDFLQKTSQKEPDQQESHLSFHLNDELSILMKLSKSVNSFHPSFVEVWTYQALKFYFSRPSKEKLKHSLLVKKTWFLLSETLKKHPTHQELLSYVGLMSLVLGNHHQMRQTFLFFDLFEQLSTIRLSQGPFAKLKVKLPLEPKQKTRMGLKKKFKKIEFELKGQSKMIQKAILEQEAYVLQTRRLKMLCQSLMDEEKREVFYLKSEIIENWKSLGRNHLAELYTLALNEEWVYQILLKEHPLKDLNIPFIGDLPIGTIWQFMQKIRFYWQQYRFKDTQLDDRFIALIENLQKELRIIG